MRLDELRSQSEIEQELLQFKLSDLHGEQIDKLRVILEKLKIKFEANKQFREKQFSDGR